MPARIKPLEQAWQVRCRVCLIVLREGEACEHIRMEAGGGVYLEHSGHSMEPDPYSEVTRGYAVNNEAADPGQG